MRKHFQVDRTLSVSPVEPWSRDDDAEEMRRYTEILQAWADVLNVAVNDEAAKDKVVAAIKGMPD